MDFSPFLRSSFFSRLEYNVVHCNFNLCPSIDPRLHSRLIDIRFGLFEVLLGFLRYLDRRLLLLQKFVVLTFLIIVVFVVSQGSQLLLLRIQRGFLD
jgi:hypothetical protein